MTDERVKKATLAILNLPGTWPSPDHAEYLARAILAVLDQQRADVTVEIQPLTVEGEAN
jgi:hypothetical protein